MWVVWLGKYRYRANVNKEASSLIELDQVTAKFKRNSSTFNLSSQAQVHWKLLCIVWL